jgi:hypothetical protein
VAAERHADPDVPTDQWSEVQDLFLMFREQKGENDEATRKLYEA